MTRYRQAKNSVLANLEKIKTFLNKGLTLNNAFQKLRKEGVIDCSLAQFYRTVPQYIDLSEYKYKAIQQPINEQKNNPPELLSYISQQESADCAPREDALPSSNSENSDKELGDAPTSIAAEQNCNTSAIDTTSSCSSTNYITHTSKKDEQGDDYLLKKSVFKSNQTSAFKHDANAELTDEELSVD